MCIYMYVYIYIYIYINAGQQRPRHRYRAWAITGYVRTCDKMHVYNARYMPILPMVLVNGGHGIGTGWSTDVPSYNPRDIVDNLKRLMEHEVM